MRSASPEGITIRMDAFGKMVAEVGFPMGGQSQYSFVRQVLPLVRAPFVLATGDCDSSVPSEVPAELAQRILASPQVIRWFTQNHDGAAPERMAPLPIGIDFHTLSERPVWQESVAPPEEQAAALESVARALPPLDERAPKLYLDFAWNRPLQAWVDILWPLRSLGSERDRAPAGARLPEGRRAIVRKLRWRSAVICQMRRLPRGEMWRRRGQYAAVLSPHGGGLDCHRTWEALALGHLVVVPSSGLDPLFEGLPVVPVRSWTEITRENLARWLSAPRADALARERLTNRYWLARMRSVTKRS